MLYDFSFLGESSSDTKRNVLIESARIARGKVQPLSVSVMIGNDLLYGTLTKIKNHLA